MHSTSIAGWSIERALQHALSELQTHEAGLFRLEVVELSCGGIVGPRTTIALVPLRTSDIARERQAEEKSKRST